MGNLEGIGEAVVRERKSRSERGDVGFIFEVGVLEEVWRLRRGRIWTVMRSWGRVTVVPVRRGQAATNM